MSKLRFDISPTGYKKVDLNFLMLQRLNEKNRLVVVNEEPANGEVPVYDATNKEWTCDTVGGMEIHDNTYHDPDYATETALTTHTGNTSNPHSVTKTQVGLSNVTNHAQLKRDAGDFVSFDEKVSVGGADYFLLEDSLATWGKKKALISNLPASIAEHDNTYHNPNYATETALTTHTSDTANPHSVTQTQVGLSNVTNHAQLKRAARDFFEHDAKDPPVEKDVLLIEDFDDTYNKKKITIETLPFATAGDISTAVSNHEAAADPHTGYQKESEKGAANGYASLNASTLVAENPANATATPTASKIPIANASGKLVAGWGGGASTLATLNASTKVVEDPANATATPTASKIPIADGSGLLDGWITTPLLEQGDEWGAFGQKNNLVDDDKFLIEDSEESFVKKWVTFADLRASLGL